MTDERKLREMMAGPGPAPVHDANGWPVDVAGLPTRRPPNVDDCALKAERYGGEYGSALAWRVRCEHGEWQEVEKLAALSRARRYHGLWPGGFSSAAEDAPDSAGPASSSASPSGTGGLAELAELLHTASTAELVQAVFDRWEGVQRALWDLTVAATYQAQIDGWTVAGRASRAVTLRAAYSIVSGISEAAVDKLLAAELDSRYGPDRAKGGEPRG